MIKLSWDINLDLTLTLLHVGQFLVNVLLILLERLLGGRGGMEPKLGIILLILFLTLS